MEPWQEEALEALKWAARATGLPQCHICEEPITTERYLDLEIFGAPVQICEDCMGEHMRHR